MTNSQKYKNYVPYPFWAMDQEFFFKYANDLQDDDRILLGYYPFKWAYVPPQDSSSAVEFLRDIGVDDGSVTAEAVAAKFDNMTSFAKLEQQGAVQWGGDILDGVPPPGFRMIPEWEPMAGVLFNWPTLFPPLWDMFRQMIGALDHVTIFLRIGEGYFGAAVLAWLEASGINLKNVRPIPGPLGDSWARDYSPLYGVNIYSGEPIAHKFTFAAFWPEYREQNRSIVEIDDRFVWKKGYNIIHIPCPEGFDHQLPGGDYTHTALYANRLMMNQRILVTVFDGEGLEKYNEEALAIYQKSLPDYAVIPIEATIQTNAGGAINCSSKEIPDVSKF